MTPPKLPNGSSELQNASPELQNGFPEFQNGSSGVQKMVGRSWVARGSVGRSRVAYFSSRSGNSRVADPHRFEYILLYSNTVWPAARADPRWGVKKNRARSLRGGGGFEMLIPQTEKLSVRHSSTLKLLGRLEGTAKPRKQRSENS